MLDQHITFTDRIWWEYYISKFLSFFVSIKVITLIFIGIFFYWLGPVVYYDAKDMLIHKYIDQNTFEKIVNTIFTNIRYMLIGVVGAFFIAKEGFKIASLFSNGHTKKITNEIKETLNTLKNAKNKINVQASMDDE